VSKDDSFSDQSMGGDVTCTFNLRANSMPGGFHLNVPGDTYSASYCRSSTMLNGCGIVITPITWFLAMLKPFGLGSECPPQLGPESELASNGVERDQMISALAPDRPDQAFSISVLPGRAERRPPVPNAHGSRAAKCSVIVTDEIFGRRVPRECFGDLVRQPLRRWVLGHRKPQQLPPSMAKNKKYE
jgi:hypothetical protein